MQLKLLFIAICISAELAHTYPQGKQANPHRVTLEGATFIAYVGSFNNKDFYIGLDLATQELARSECEAEGLSLAKLDTQEELNFIYQNTYEDENSLWTSGSAHFGHSAFKFDDESEINTVIEINGGNDYPPVFGLVIDRYADNTDLRVLYSDSLRLYLCYRQL